MGTVQTPGLLAKLIFLTMVSKSQLRFDPLSIIPRFKNIFTEYHSVQPSLPLPADQPVEGQAGGGGQRKGDQRLLLRRLARQDRPEQHQLRVRQLTSRPAEELSQLEADECDVQPRDQQKVGRSGDHCLL